MLKWLKSRRKKADQKRLIFEFHDGRHARRADPMEIWFALEADEEFLIDSTPALVDDGDTKAIKIACDATRRAFGVPKFEDGGLTAEECLSLLVYYLLYVESVKKNTSEQPISSPPTEPELSATSTTNAGSGSSATSNDPSSDKPRE